MASRKKIKMKVETQHHQRSLPPPCPAEAFICGNTVDLIFREIKDLALKFVHKIKHILKCYKEESLNLFTVIQN